jgi:hypothetical protein
MAVTEICDNWLWRKFQGYALPRTVKGDSDGPIATTINHRNVAVKASAAARLLRAYVAQVEVLRRLRNGGSQFVRVEHVHVHEGGQAVVGNVRSPV